MLLSFSTRQLPSCASQSRSWKTMHTRLTRLCACPSPLLTPVWRSPLPLLKWPLKTALVSSDISSLLFVRDHPHLLGHTQRLVSASWIFLMLYARMALWFRCAPSWRTQLISKPQLLLTSQLCLAVPFVCSTDPLFIATQIYHLPSSLPLFLSLLHLHPSLPPLHPHPSLQLCWTMYLPQPDLSSHKLTEDYVYPCPSLMMVWSPTPWASQPHSLHSHLARTSIPLAPLWSFRTLTVSAQFVWCSNW